MAKFGGFDIWVNNAGISIFGRIWDVPIADWHRMFDTVYWGAVHGSLQALKHLRDTEKTGSIQVMRLLGLSNAASAPFVVFRLSYGAKLRVFVQDGRERRGRSNCSSRLQFNDSILSAERGETLSQRFILHLLSSNKPVGDNVLQRSLAFDDAVGKVLAQENRP